MLLIYGSLNYTQFKCLNGVEDLSWSIIVVQQAPTWRIKIYAICPIHAQDNFMWIHDFSLYMAKFFYKFASKNFGFLNIKSFKSKQYNLQANAFGFHGYLIVEILNIFCVILYARMIIAFLKQLIGSTRSYMVLAITLCNDLLEKNNLLRRICMFRCTSRFSSSFPSPIR